MSARMAKRMADDWVTDFGKGFKIERRMDGAAMDRAPRRVVS